MVNNKIFTFLYGDDIPKKAWGEFVKNHPQGTVFQTPEMYCFYAHSNHSNPLAIALCNSKKEILAVMVAVIITNGAAVLRPITARSIIIGGPLVSSMKDEQEILLELFDEYRRILPKYVIYSEIRPVYNMDLQIVERLGFVREGHYNMSMDIQLDKEQLWNRMHKERRKNVNKAKNKGLTYKEIFDDAEVEKAVGLIKKTYGRKRVPTSNVEVFQKWRQVLNGYLRFYAVFYQDEMVSCQARLCYKELAYAWYTGSDERYHSFKPNDFLTWNDICEAHDKGFQTYDIGGGGKPGVPYGVRDYKLKFGFEMYDYGRYLCVHKKLLYFLGVQGMNLIKSKK